MRTLNPSVPNKVSKFSIQWLTQLKRMCLETTIYSSGREWSVKGLK